MARHIYQVTAPDGTTLVHTTRTDVVNSWAVIGLLKLKAPLPKVNPDDKTEEVRWERHTRWIMIGTTPTEARAKNLAVSHGYVGAQEDFRIIPVVPTVSKGKRPGAAADEDEDETPAPVAIIDEPEPAFDLDAL